MAKRKAKTKTAVRNYSPGGLDAVKKNLSVQRKHGAFEFFRKNVAPVPGCGQCVVASGCEYYRKDQKQCAAILELQDEMFEDLSNLDHVRPVDKYIVDRFVKNYCFVIVVERWLAEVGPFQATDSGLDVQPVLAAKANHERLALKYAQELGIGPQARASLNLTNVQGYCFAEALQQVKPKHNPTVELLKQDDEDSTDDGSEAEGV